VVGQGGVPELVGQIINVSWEKDGRNKLKSQKLCKMIVQNAKILR
jgi:hypothetical protein